MLWRPVRGRVVLKYSGQLAVAVGLFALIPVAASIVLGDLFLTPWYGGLSLLLCATGLALSRIDAPEDVRANEALVIPALSFLVTPLLFAAPSIAAGLAPVDAIFESVSGITTTGLSTLGSVEGRPRTLLFVRSWQQWIGGLGVVIFAIALFVGPGVAARRLGEETLTSESLVRSTRSRARSFLGAYVGLTVFGCSLLWLSGLGVFDALTQTFASVSTGGFASHDASLAAFPAWWQRAAVIFVCILGAVSFVLYAPSNGAIGVRRIFRDPGLISLIALGLGVSALLALFESRGGGASAAALRELPLLGFSAQTTAGFASLPVGELAPASKLVLIGAMVVGGNVGSTAGGIKLLRVLILLRVVQTAIRRRSMPEHAVLSVQIGGRRVEDADTIPALSLALLFVIVIVASWLPFLAYGHAPLDALFEVASATGTVGLSTGLVGPGLETPLKWVLCADMWLGRLEVLPLLVALHPGTWTGRREPGRRA